MHGLINKSIQTFVQDTYGNDVWADVAATVGLDDDGFEAMLTYDDALTHAVIDSAGIRLKKSRTDFLEDLGTYLVSHPNMWRIRRLLRFGGGDLVDFLDSLDELADRSKLAVPDLDMPGLQVESEGGERFVVRCDGVFDGVEHVLLGGLRAMADDYGALAIAQTLEDEANPEARGVEITLLSTSFASGNSFELAATA